VLTRGFRLDWMGLIDIRPCSSCTGRPWTSFCASRASGTPLTVIGIERSKTKKSKKRKRTQSRTPYQNPSAGIPMIGPTWGHTRPRARETHESGHNPGPRCTPRRRGVCEGSIAMRRNVYLQRRSLEAFGRWPRAHATHRLYFEAG
jgi:hypothetical protein